MVRPEAELPAQLTSASDFDGLRGLTLMRSLRPLARKSARNVRKLPALRGNHPSKGEEFVLLYNSPSKLSHSPHLVWYSVKWCERLHIHSSAPALKRRFTTPPCYTSILHLTSVSQIEEPSSRFFTFDPECITSHSSQRPHPSLYPSLFRVPAPLGPRTANFVAAWSPVPGPTGEKEPTRTTWRGRPRLRLCVGVVELTSEAPRGLTPAPRDGLGFRGSQRPRGSSSHAAAKASCLAEAKGPSDEEPMKRSESPELRLVGFRAGGAKPKQRRDGRGLGFRANEAG